MAKIVLKYKNGEIPENLSDVLANADEQDLRILVALMMAADENGAVSEEVSLGDMLGLKDPRSTRQSNSGEARASSVRRERRRTTRMMQRKKRSRRRKYKRLTAAVL